MFRPRLIFNPLQFSLRRHLSMPVPSPPRPSASLILLSHTNRILLLQRSAQLSFASAHVFPGGLLSASDNNSARLCALRETFEETGLLLTTSPPPPGTPLAEIQQAVHAGTVDFKGWVESWGGALLGDEELRAFTTWVTPAQMKKRYEAQMFLARLPEWVEEDVVVGDGGKEVVGRPRWMHPDEVLREVAEGKVVLYPPQLYLVSRLERCLREGGEERLLKWAQEMGGRICEPRREAVTKEGWWVMGLGPRGDRDVVVLLEVPKIKGVEPRALEVVERGRMRERLEKL
jgi:8-oxo-dGTP pyrophosphatase MutT (NUDIX family)